MKRTLKKILFISLIFSAAAPTTMQANFNWTTLRNGAIVATALAVTAFVWYKLKSARTQRKLEKAIESGNLPEAKEAIVNGANIDKYDSLGRTPLTMAIKCDHLKILELLLTNKANVNKKNRPVDDYRSSSHTPLIQAAGKGHLEAVKLLLKNNANPDKQNNYGLTPLMYAVCGDYAVSCGHLEIVELLLKTGASVNKQDQFGYTALMRCWNSNIAELLLANGADVNIENFQGETALKLTTEKLAKEKERLAQYEKPYIFPSPVDLIVSLLKNTHQKRSSEKNF